MTNFLVIYCVSPPAHTILSGHSTFRRSLMSFGRKVIKVGRQGALRRVYGGRTSARVSRNMARKYPFSSSVAAAPRLVRTYAEMELLNCAALTAPATSSRPTLHVIAD